MQPKPFDIFLIAIFVVVVVVAAIVVLGPHSAVLVRIIPDHYLPRNHS